MSMRITEECVDCGACLDACPRGAISESGDGYAIDPGRCDGCGGADPPPCAEVCPVEGAIAPLAPGEAPPARPEPIRPAPSPARPAPARDRAAFSWGLSLTAFALGLAFCAGLFGVGYQAMPLEAPQLAVSGWILPATAGLIALLGLGLTLVLQARGLGGVARWVGGLLGLVLAGIGCLSLQLGLGLTWGVAMFVAAVIVMGVALLRRGKER